MARDVISDVIGDVNREYLSLRVCQRASLETIPDSHLCGAAWNVLSPIV
jgi:hypothetical protein